MKLDSSRNNPQPPTQSDDRARKQQLSALRSMTRIILQQRSGINVILDAIHNTIRQGGPDLLLLVPKLKERRGTLLAKHLDSINDLAASIPPGEIRLLAVAKKIQKDGDALNVEANDAIWQANTAFWDMQFLGLSTGLSADSTPGQVRDESRKTLDTAANLPKGLVKLRVVSTNAEVCSYQHVALSDDTGQEAELADTKSLQVKKMA